VSIEAAILAVVSAIRPSTSLAAVYALLSTSRPRQLLAPFILCGFAVSAGIGILVVSVLNGVDLPGGRSDFTAVVDIAAGVGALGFAAGMWSGRVSRPRRGREPSEPSWPVRMLRRPSLKVAAAAGVMTHVPGLFYLVALNAIAAPEPAVGEAVGEVLIYNVIWFSVPIAAFVFAGRRPLEAHDLMSRVSDWGRRHQQVVAVGVFAAVGAFLLVKGVTDLVS
jgi:Sap-like sulfolipid-1-addressing protein